MRFISSAISLEGKLVKDVTASLRNNNALFVNWGNCFPFAMFPYTKHYKTKHEYLGSNEGKGNLGAFVSGTSGIKIIFCFRVPSVSKLLKDQKNKLYL